MTGCILSNELLDAFPVHQVTVEHGRLREMYVALQGGEPAMQTGEPSTPLLALRLDELGVELAEGQIAEINLALDQWIEEAAQSLERGFVLTIDYGRPAEELYSATERFRGTLTTFHRHLQTDQPLRRIGQQDMSAQVDFTALAKPARGPGWTFWATPASENSCTTWDWGNWSGSGPRATRDRLRPALPVCGNWRNPAGWGISRSWFRAGTQGLPNCGASTPHIRRQSWRSECPRPGPRRST